MGEKLEFIYTKLKKFDSNEDLKDLLIEYEQLNEEIGKISTHLK